MKNRGGVLLGGKTTANVRIWTSCASIQSPMDTLPGYPISMHIGHTYTNTQDAFSSCLLAVWMTLFVPLLFVDWQSEWSYLFQRYLFIGSLNDGSCFSAICLLAVPVIVFVPMLFVCWQSEWLFIGSLNGCICSYAICLLAVWMIAFIPALHFQAAFSQVLENIGLCPRIVPLSALCEKFGIQQYTPSPQFQVGSFITHDNVTDWLVHYDFFNTKFSPETYWWVSRSQEVGGGGWGGGRKTGDCTQCYTDIPSEWICLKMGRSVNHYEVSVIM